MNIMFTNCVAFDVIYFQHEAFDAKSFCFVKCQEEENKGVIISPWLMLSYITLIVMSFLIAAPNMDN